MRKRLLSILLCLVMVTGLFPTVAFAADKTADGMTQELADLREIVFNQQQEMPDVRFMGENISNAEIIRRADVIWIQTNCIGHAAYYGIINLARRYNRKVRYFQYASAAKCAEQIAEEEEKSKK